MLIAILWMSGLPPGTTLRARRYPRASDPSAWTVSDSKGDEHYYFPAGYVLGAGATVRLHSGKDGVDTPPGDIYWTDKTVWNNGGETVSLRDAQDALVSEYNY